MCWAKGNYIIGYLSWTGTQVHVNTIRNHIGHSKLLNTILTIVVCTHMLFVSHTDKAAPDKFVM